jgi:hypothetical protein
MKQILKMTMLLMMVFPLYLSSCKDDPPEGPGPPSDSNYWSLMTCKVDGNDWGDCLPGLMLGMKQSKSSAEWFKNYIGQPLIIEFINLCDSSNSKNAVQSIYVNLNPYSGIGTYQLNNFSYGACANLQSTYIMRTDDIYTGSITITKFDTIKKEIFGTLDFEAYNSDSNRIVKVSGGKFSKVKFITN